ncbi:ArsR/SmtB family transcription factor [Thalassospira lucentensis]|uniref:ArsR/SmtB family transcription factor n=1 Tax=Thalassospira lucentensis TaxID=168935 RepID=UPI003D2ED189
MPLNNYKNSYNGGMKETDIAPILAALGHTARLGIFRLLVRAGNSGLNIGEIGRLTGLPASTLAHHLGALVQVGLVQQEKHGREVVNHADILAVHNVLGALIDECCIGVDVGQDEEKV